ncbi:allophanate hydrolase subunit 1 [Mycobacterium sp. SMC-4]|uniref:5-oxoprolinase subunit B family protein n=1 Tax=Mycobacterium sp. SMC-4 TaxID=2857059 RepID=UPI0021B21D42|nr:allophanate hydrolase subunit 1 [Mycobacterium sp. SMC-4]UXA18397.1 allophanate hydrolase subunit 1 [Mycobacterium sp. SMC-4]
MSVTADSLCVTHAGHTIRDYGDRALLLELADTSEVLAFHEALRCAELPGVVDVVPAATTVLVKLAGHCYLAPTRQRLACLAVEPGGDTATPPAGQADVVIEVCYDGEDLDEVARLTDRTPQQVVAAHTEAPWRVGFSGFAPGFAYLVGAPQRLVVPRRSEPRTKVPVGSVGLADGFSGIYPRESPGGWQLIGRTSAVLWDIERDDPALLTPGMWVQFHAVDGVRP